MTSNKSKIQTCNVGLFNLPGAIVDTDQYTKELLDQLVEWVSAHGGKLMNTGSYGQLWSFRKEEHRNWFVLKWS